MLPQNNMKWLLKRITVQTKTRRHHNLHISSNNNFKALCLIHYESTIHQQQEELNGELALQIQNTLKKYRDSPTRKIELALSYCSPTVSQDLALNVLKRHRSDWKPAFIFFNWVCKERQGYVNSVVYNEMLDILGKMHRFEEFGQVFDEMSKRDGLVDEETYRVLVNRFAAAHKVEEAIGVFKMRKELGLELDGVAFQKLLMFLCRYKHVEVAETLLDSMGHEFGLDTKTLNIVLNGWCVLGNVAEAKRFWKDIIISKCQPDLFTYGTFIKALTKKGKLGSALKLYREMWEGKCQPDVVICNCVIDALCFKKRIPEALDVFREMSERGCLPNAATYNSLIKHLCKIRRMDKVHELLDEMEEKKGSCLPNDITFNYLLKSLKQPQDIPIVMERMTRNGCSVNVDTYNLILKLYLDWKDEEHAIKTWNEMEKLGLGPDKRSYTIRIHWLYEKGRFEEALSYASEMTSKGMVMEPRTEILINDMKTKLKEKKTEEPKRDLKSVNSGLLRNNRQRRTYSS